MNPMKKNIQLLTRIVQSCYALNWSSSDRKLYGLKEVIVFLLLLYISSLLNLQFQLLRKLFPPRKRVETFSALHLPRVVLLHLETETLICICKLNVK